VFTLFNHAPNAYGLPCRRNSGMGGAANKNPIIQVAYKAGGMWFEYARHGPIFPFENLFRVVI